MMYKNTFKLLFANYSKVWKVFAYLLFAVAFTVGLAVACGFPIYNTLLKAGMFTELGDIYADFLNKLNLHVFIASVGEWVADFVGVIFSNIDTLLVYIILLAVVVFVFGSLIVGLYKFAYTDNINYFMNSSVNTPFTSALITNSGRNALYQLFNLLILQPINLSITILIVLALNFINDANILWLAPMAAVLIYSFLTSLKITLFGGWVPAMVVKNYGVIKGLKENFRVCTRRFFYTFSSAFALTLTVMFVNIFGGLCTFGVGLIFTLPASICAVCVFNIVAYYTNIGQRYYTDANNVCAPIRQEFTDQFNKHKYII